MKSLSKFPFISPFRWSNPIKFPEVPTWMAPPQRTRRHCLWRPCGTRWRPSGGKKRAEHTGNSRIWLGVWRFFGWIFMDFEWIFLPFQCFFWFCGCQGVDFTVISGSESSTAFLVGLSTNQNQGNSQGQFHWACRCGNCSCFGTLHEWTPTKHGFF